MLVSEMYITPLIEGLLQAAPTILVLGNTNQPTASYFIFFKSSVHRSAGHHYVIVISTPAQFSFTALFSSTPILHGLSVTIVLCLVLDLLREMLKLILVLSITPYLLSNFYAVTIHLFLYIDLP